MIEAGRPPKAKTVHLRARNSKEATESLTVLLFIMNKRDRRTQIPLGETIQYYTILCMHEGCITRNKLEFHVHIQEPIEYHTAREVGHHRERLQAVALPTRDQLQAQLEAQKHSAHNIQDFSSRR